MNDAIEFNAATHDRVHAKYEKIHGEIFNPIEQQRLQMRLKQAVSCIKSNSTKKEALDFGCGTGNLTRNLIDLHFHVVSADVSTKFLALIKQKFGQTGMVETLVLNGQNLSNIENNRFDFVATYSVLHHVPDYLRIIEEMIRVTKPGGIIYIDHEACQAYWDKDTSYVKFFKKLPFRLNKLFQLSNYLAKIMQMFKPRYQLYGDIHVYPDDHIEWDKIENLLIARGCEIAFENEYLLYKSDYPEDTYQEYKDKCNDMKLIVARKN